MLACFIELNRLKGILHTKEKFFGSQNAAGVSQENDVAVMSQAIMVNGDQKSNI